MASRKIPTLVYLSLIYHILGTDRDVEMRKDHDCDLRVLDPKVVSLDRRRHPQDVTITS